MIVLDANILIRAVLGRRVRQLLETYAPQGIRFFAPGTAFAEAEKHLPPLLRKRNKTDADVSATLKYLQHMIEPIDLDTYGLFEEEARQRLLNRDEQDWPVLAAAMALSCAIQRRAGLACARGGYGSILCDLDRRCRLLWDRYCRMDNQSHRDIPPGTVEICSGRQRVIDCQKRERPIAN